jgi:hypothetical protein
VENNESSPLEAARKSPYLLVVVGFSLRECVVKNHLFSEYKFNNYILGIVEHVEIAAMLNP